MTRLARIGRMAVVAAAAACILAPAAFAAPAPSYYGTGTVYTDPGLLDPAFIASGAGLQLADGTQPSGLSSTPTSDLLLLSYGGLTASSSYSSEAGVLKVKSFVAAQPVDLASGTRTVSAAADARLRDYLEVLGPTPGAVGSATLTFSMTVTGSLYAPDSTTGAAPYVGGTSMLAKLGATWTDTGGADGACSPVCGIEFWQAQGDAGDGFYAIGSEPQGTFSITVPYGTVVQLDAIFIVGGGLVTSSFADLAASADYSTSLHFYVDVTPGATLASSSGHDYASIVPEPGMAALALPGLWLVLATARRRR
jgi:hypothetical protein